jgi:hypothetical protein
MTNTASDRSETTMYAVFRNGFRVSESEYDSKLDANREMDYWQNIVKRNPDGSRLEIRQLNSRNYRY